MLDVIKSVAYSDTEILSAVSELYLNNQPFELDPTYSKGIFYKNFAQPKYKFDLNPQQPNTIQADCANLPIDNNLITSIIFDPPFMFGTHGQTKNNIMNKRFTMFDSWEELESMYRNSLKEFFRILTKRGILLFKCQDYTDSRTTMTHCFVYQWAMEQGFKIEDIFILVATGGRIWNPKLIQRHARKFHSYYFVFKK